MLQKRTADNVTIKIKEWKEIIYGISPGYFGKTYLKYTHFKAKLVCMEAYNICGI